MDYYLRDKAQPEGPYDLMSIIRKIRNGTVTESTMLSEGAAGELKTASQIPQLQEFFHGADGDEVIISHVVHQPKAERGIGEVLTQSIEFLRLNPSIAIYSGLFVVGWLLVSLLFLVEANIVKSLLGVALSYFLLGGYFYGVHRYVMGSPLRVDDVLAHIGASSVQMTLVSLIVAFCLLPPLLLVHVFLPETLLSVSLPVVFIVLFVVLAFFAFVPLLIVQKGFSCKAAIKESCKLVMANKGENLGVIFALTTLNFLFLPFLPVVLPVTSVAIADLYEEHFG